MKSSIISFGFWLIACLFNSCNPEGRNPVLTIYRGGTDESTFGPNVKIADCSMKNCGKGKRNKSGNAIYLHGVQLAKIDKLNLSDCADFRLFLTNGDPVTKIDGYYPKAELVSNSKLYEITGLTHNSNK